MGWGVSPATLWSAFLASIWTDSVPLLAGVGVLAAGFLGLLVLGLRRCPDKKMLCIYSGSGERRTVRFVRGGTTFVWPGLQKYYLLDLGSFTIEVTLSRILKEDIPTSPLSFALVLAVGNTELLLQRAAMQFIGKDDAYISSTATAIVLEQMRQAAGNATAAQVEREREKYLPYARRQVDEELAKLGLVVIKVVPVSGQHSLSESGAAGRAAVVSPDTFASERKPGASGPHAAPAAWQPSGSGAHAAADARKPSGSGSTAHLWKPPAASSSATRSSLKPTASGLNMATPRQLLRAPVSEGTPGAALPAPTADTKEPKPATRAVIPPPAATTPASPSAGASQVADLPTISPEEAAKLVASELAGTPVPPAPPKPVEAKPSSSAPASTGPSPSTAKPPTGEITALTPEEAARLVAEELAATKPPPATSPAKQA